MSASPASVRVDGAPAAAHAGPACDHPDNRTAASTPRSPAASGSHDFGVGISLTNVGEVIGHDPEDVVAVPPGQGCGDLFYNTFLSLNDEKIFFSSKQAASKAVMQNLKVNA